MRDGELYQLDVILGSLRDEYKKNGYIDSGIRILPKGILIEWLSAMHRLQGEGVLYFAVTDRTGNIIYGDFVDDDNESGWYYSVYDFNYVKFRGFCAKNNVPIDNPNLGNGIRAKLKITIGGIPRVSVGRTIYHFAGFSSGTLVDDIVQIASSRENFGRVVSRDELKDLGVDVGKKSLRNIFQHNIFAKELKPFAIITPNTIQFLPVAWLSEKDLKELAKKSRNQTLE